MNPWKLSRIDRDAVFYDVGRHWEKLRGRRLFITGGTGFFGCWLLETLAWANDQMRLGVRATVLTRDRSAFARRQPHLADRDFIDWLDGDVRNFEFPADKFPFVIHAAAETSGEHTAEIITQGTLRMREFLAHQPVERLLYVSSGAVYGPQPTGIELMPEAAAQMEDNTVARQTTYGEAKLAAERLMQGSPARSGVSVARCYALIGPYLPLQRQFAIGNFIRDALRGKDIEISGHGATRRSYLYGSDLAVCLWRLLLDPAGAGTFNVGSEEHHALREVADRIAALAGNGVGVRVALPPAELVAGDRYVPSTARLRSALGWAPRVSLDEGIARTLEFYRANPIDLA